MIQKLELYSQIPLIKTFTSLASKLYFPSTPYTIKINLEAFHICKPIKLIEDESKLLLDFGRLFYNSLTLIQFGEEASKILGIWRPVNRVILPRMFRAGYARVEHSEDEVFLKKANESVMQRDLKARLVKIKQNSKSSDYLIVNFHKDFPVYYNFMGKLKSNANLGKIKYDTFIKKEQNSTFNPIVKNSILAKIKSNPDKYTSIVLKGEIDFKCYVFSREKPNIFIINSKNIQVDHTLTETKNETIWQEYLTYLLAFPTKLVGQYYIYNENLIVHSDFFLSRIQLIDP